MKKACKIPVSVVNDVTDKTYLLIVQTREGEVITDEPEESLQNLTEGVFTYFYNHNIATYTWVHQVDLEEQSLRDIFEQYDYEMSYTTKK